MQAGINSHDYLLSCLVPVASNKTTAEFHTFILNGSHVVPHLAETPLLKFITSQPNLVHLSLTNRLRITDHLIHSIKSTKTQYNHQRNYRNEDADHIGFYQYIDHRSSVECIIEKSRKKYHIS